MTSTKTQDTKRLMLAAQVDNAFMGRIDEAIDALNRRRPAMLFNRSDLVRAAVEQFLEDIEDELADLAEINADERGAPAPVRKRSAATDVAR